MRDRLADSLRDKKYQGSDVLEEAPTVILAPSGLYAQWQQALQRAFQPGVIDLIPYIGTYETRRNWYADVYRKSKQPVNRRVVLTTYSVRNSIVRGRTF